MTIRGKGPLHQLLLCSRRKAFVPERTGSRTGSGRTQDLLFWYLAADALVIAVNDGWSGRPAPLEHQLFLLPISAAFLVVLFRLLGSRKGSDSLKGPRGIPLTGAICSCVILELGSISGFFYEQRHFARFGYLIRPATGWFCAGLVVVTVCLAVRRRTAWTSLIAIAGTYAAGMLLAIRSFPLSYLRSDMLPVILWADQRLVSGLNPYGTMHVESRVYDFPYLPGMLVGFLPAVVLHVDVRYVTLLCVVLIALLLYGVSDARRRPEAASLIAFFVLSPFLQYRHDLYLEPHWLALVGAVVLLKRGRPIWAAGAFGLSMGIYQLSWVLFPFLLLYAWRRRGWVEVAKTAAMGVAGMLLLVGPFLRSATERIANNTVGQWSRLPHALADPMNASYWVTYLVRPDQLKWVQLGVLTALFSYCVAKKRCGDLQDTLRWMCVALAVFIALNVLVDGYFYLTLLLVLLMYTLAATGIWAEPALGRGWGTVDDRGQLS